MSALTPPGMIVGGRVAPAEQAVHLARVARHLEGLEVELAREPVQRPHDVGDRL